MSGHIERGLDRIYSQLRLIALGFHIKFSFIILIILIIKHTTIEEDEINQVKWFPQMFYILYMSVVLLERQLTWKENLVLVDCKLHQNIASLPDQLMNNARAQPNLGQDMKKKKKIARLRRSCDRYLKKKKSIYSKHFNL